MKKLLLFSTLALTSFGVQAVTVSFTAQDVENAMGIPLHDGTYQWGLWAVRAMPVVTGNYTLVSGSGSTTQTGWGNSVPNGAFGSAPYSPANSAWFYDYSGSEVAGNPANPLYMIMDQPANTFPSFGFKPDGSFDPTPSPSEINVVTKVGDLSTFSFSFNLDPGATWSGQVQFVVDGSKYTLGTAGSPGNWVEDFYGGYGDNGGLSGNSGNGYSLTPTVVPDSGSTMLLLGLGFFPLAVFGFKQKRVQMAE